MASPRRFCADASAARGEPLGATASRIEHWILVEYSGLWARDELGESLIPEPVKAHLRRRLASLPRSRLLFVRRPERRRPGGYRVYVGRTAERGSTLRTVELERYDDLLELSLGGNDGEGEPLGHPLLVVCTHGKRDPCCARHGRPLYDELRARAEPGWVWQSTHVGGDRFAGNLVCLPEGLYFGRVSRADAGSVLAEYLEGRIDLARYRGRSCYPFRVQAAERTLREQHELRSVDALRLLGQESRGEGCWTIRFAAGGKEYEVEVKTELGEPTQLTCAALTPRRPRRYRARSAGSPPERAA